MINMIFLVDLNRMKFHNSMDIKLRMKNLSDLHPKKMVKVMADEYAKISNQIEDLFNLLWGSLRNFNLNFIENKKSKKS